MARNVEHRSGPNLAVIAAALVVAGAGILVAVLAATGSAGGPVDAAQLRANGEEVMEALDLEPTFDTVPVQGGVVVQGDATTTGNGVELVTEYSDKLSKIGWIPNGKQSSDEATVTFGFSGDDDAEVSITITVPNADAPDELLVTVMSGPPVQP